MMVYGMEECAFKLTEKQREDLRKIDENIIITPKKDDYGMISFVRTFNIAVYFFHKENSDKIYAFIKSEISCFEEDDVEQINSALRILEKIVEVLKIKVSIRMAL